MEDDIVKTTRAKADVWQHFGLKKRKSDFTIVDGVAVCFIGKMQPGRVHTPSSSPPVRRFVTKFVIPEEPR